MLTRLHVKGYKSLIDVDVASKPLTVLCINRGTQVTSFETWEPLGRKPAAVAEWENGPERLPIADRILRGDFDA